MEPNLPTYQDNFPEENETFRAKLTEFIQTLIIFAAIIMIIYFFVARPHKVFGSSMYPTFHSGDYIITDQLSYRLGNPERGDVIVFKDPLDLSQDFIKRVIGLPGERVKVQDGHVYINDKLLPEPYLDSSVVTGGRDFLPDGEEKVVPPGDYFVMGDNRPDSSDSRSWGFITRGEIIGKAFFRYWPQNVIGLIPSVHYPPPFNTNS